MKLEDVPRIRGRVGQIAEPSELAGKWAFEISMWDFYGKEQIGDPFGPFGCYETEALAKDAMREACRKACEAVGGSPDSYMDMKNGGVLRQWEEN